MASSAAELGMLSWKMDFDNPLHFYPVNNHIWLMWTDEFKVTPLLYSDQHITVDISNNLEDFNVTCSFFIYASININVRQKLWEDLTGFSQQGSSPWILIGDFNTIASWDEKRGGNRKNGKAIRDFNEFMASVGVSDAGFEGAPFTWSNNQNGSSRIWEKLDRCLVNGFDQTSLGGTGSTQSSTGFLFKAEKDHRYLETGDVNQTIKEANLLLESLEMQLQNGWKDDINGQIKNVRVELNNLQRFQYGMLEEKARITWMKKGDRNTQFFHASIKAIRA
ncbi:hypothetical protein QQ045_019199 [Rhodiola kirilowii]